MYRGSYIGAQMQALRLIVGSIPISGHRVPRFVNRFNEKRLATYWAGDIGFGIGSGGSIGNGRMGEYSTG